MATVVPGGPMTLVWFIVWVICDHVGAREPIRLDPANIWGTTLILVVALDLVFAGRKRSRP